MQNSLDVLFAGLAANLRDTVLPAVDDPYAQAQVAAAVELLGNIGSRVEWRTDHLAETVRRCRAVLDVAVADAEPTELPESRRLLAESVPHHGTALTGSRDDHLRALAEVTSWAAGSAAGDTRVDAALRDFLAWQLDDEAARTRTGMYKSRVASAAGRREAAS